MDLVFNDTIPFDDVSLFNERRDDDVFDTKNDNNTADLKANLSSNTIRNDVTQEATVSNENTMPDAFWTVEESKELESNQEEPSFDDQIEALIGDNPKVKKKVI